MLPSGKMVLEYSGAVHESIFAELRVCCLTHTTVDLNPSLLLAAEF